MSDRIEKTTDVKAPIERVWRALTDHEEFGQWFKVRLDDPFVPGGESTGMITYPGYEHIKWHATVIRMEPPHVFAYTWPHPEEMGGEAEGAPTTLVEFRLEEIHDGTRVTVVESGFDALPDGRGAEAMRRNEGGWAEQMTNIKAHVEG